ncbi:hypothetical protein SNOG_11433 [Parastagonospora nodorum SN15]|uniref:Uncharacterized protein n=1 Tax=Phaeosphaeria nodorum (strain SN15 / ATCC MYA-4574 / FGSC 10173) TaxID=321614 RepID=Q0U9Y1_PHANO|nr:hypothetical protein SNOG_11433 [Parastagonospora nodorum SN15]EAT81141.1 hypothetical protein SNOG_11433 [Parastagonospora nodorum SN15]
MGRELVAPKTIRELDAPRESSQARGSGEKLDAPEKDFTSP